MKNKKLNITLYTLVIILTICVVSYTGYNIYGKNSQSSGQSLILHYNDIQSIYDASDVIVIGEIKKVNEPIVIDHRDYVMLGSNDKKEDFMEFYLKFNVSELKVEKVLKGDVAKDKSIEVLQQVTYDNNSDKDLKKVKIFKDKEKYVLFLKYYDIESEQSKKDFKTPKYFPVGMYQGQLEIIDNKVKIDKEKSFIFDNNSMTIEEIEKAISECEAK